VRLYGWIGEDFWGGGLTAQYVVQQIEALPFPATPVRTAAAGTVGGAVGRAEARP